MTELTADDFVFLAVKGFGLGYFIGFLHWSFSYACRVIRKSFFAGARIADL